MIPPYGPVKVQRCNHPLLRERKITLFVQREDLVHPYLSGNKWRKLKYNLEDFKLSGATMMLTFGGAYSNHLVATAAASYLSGIPLIVVIRGEPHPENPYQEFIRSCGTKMIFISRTLYREKGDPDFIRTLLENQRIHPDACYVIPEGGANDAGTKGCEEICNDVPDESGWIACACGTGTTAAGIARAMKDHQKFLGFAVLNAGNYIRETMIKSGADEGRFHINEDYVFGRYAKVTHLLKNFIKNFHLQTGILTEPVYTGKMFLGLLDLIEQRYFREGSVITAIHTGGVLDFSIPLKW